MRSAPHRRGRLIVIEGIDGAGKSTLANGLVRAIRARHLIVRRAREPFDAELGRLGASASARDPWLAALWFTLDRIASRRTVERALERSDIVVQDRSFYSTLAYQGSALGPALRRRLDLLERTVSLHPDLVVLVNLDPAEALSRLARRGARRSPLERLSVLRRTARAYQGYARRERWLVVDGRLPTEECVARVVRRLRPLR